MRYRGATSLLSTFAVLVMFSVPLDLLADEHVVSSAEIHRQVELAASQRAENMAQVEKFFSSRLAKRAFSGAKWNETEIRAAIAFLSDTELARLAVQTDQVQKDFAAGRLTTQQVTYIILGAIAIIIIAILAHR